VPALVVLDNDALQEPRASAILLDLDRLHVAQVGKDEFEIGRVRLTNANETCNREPERACLVVTDRKA